MAEGYGGFKWRMGTVGPNGGVVRRVQVAECYGGTKWRRFAVGPSGKGYRCSEVADGKVYLGSEGW